MICVGAPEEPRLKLAREFGAEATVNIEEIKSPQDRIARVREIVGHFGADLVMDCSGHPTAGPEGIEMLRDGGTYVEMGQFTDAGSIETSWHRICTKDLNVLGSWGFTGNDLPLGVDMLYRTRDKYPLAEDADDLSVHGSGRRTGGEGCDGDEDREIDHRAVAGIGGLDNAVHSTRSRSVPGRSQAAHLCRPGRRRDRGRAAARRLQAARASRAALCLSRYLFRDGIFRWPRDRVTG